MTTTFGGNKDSHSAENSSERQRTMELSRRKLTGPKPKSRAITGPTPHAVAMLARPRLKRPADYLILERLKKENRRDLCVAHVKYIDTSDLRNMFLEDTDRKILQNTIQRKVDSMLLQEKCSLNERREKLRELITSEEDMYMQEMADKEETLLERQARMRDRARTLREKRERERAAEAERRLEQRWRDQCEELRGIKFQRHLVQVTKDRAEQLRLKEEERKRDEKQEEIYAKMWKEDWAIKSKREDMETALQIERNKEMLDILNTQSAVKEQERLDLKTLVEQEAQLMREEAALRAVEEIKLKEDKKRRQRENKSILDCSLKIKMRNRAREVQEELAFDMKLLEQMLAEHTNETQENLQRKKQLKEEVRIYRQHLHEEAEEERQIEKQLDTIISAEVEKQWERRIAQWMREKEARQKLLQDVLNIRKQQVQDKLTVIAEEKAEIERDRIRMQRNVKEHEELERKQEETARQAKRIYGRDLIQQMDYLELAKESEKQQLKDEWESCKAAEANYHRKVQEAIATMTPERVHPTRLMLSGKACL